MLGWRDAEESRRGGAPFDLFGVWCFSSVGISYTVREGIAIPTGYTEREPSEMGDTQVHRRHSQEKGCLARGERGRWVGQRAATAAGPPARTPAAEAGEGE